MQLSILLYHNNIIYYVDKETGQYFKRYYEQSEFPNPLSHFSVKLQAVLIPVILLLNNRYRELGNPMLDGILLIFGFVLVLLFHRSFQTFYSNLVKEFYHKTNQHPIEDYKPTLNEKRELYQLLVKSMGILKWFNRLLIVMVLSCLYLFVKHHHLFALLAMVLSCCGMVLLYVSTDFREKKIRFFY